MSPAETLRSAPADASLDAVDLVERRSTVALWWTSLFSYRELIRNLVLKDLKLKYRGSVLGFVWSLVNPLLMIIVYTVAFRYILRIRTEGFVFFLMLGLLPWSFFANATMMATGAIVDNGGLLKSVFFPRAILPISTVLFNLAQFLLTAVVFLPVMLFLYSVSPARPMLLFPVVLALQVLLTIGLALALSAATALFRDMRHFVEVGLALGFWATPIFYRLDEVPRALQGTIAAMPLTPFVTAYHRMFFDQRWPEPAVLGLAVAYAVAALVLGTVLFQRVEDQLPERV